MYKAKACVTLGTEWVESVNFWTDAVKNVLWLGSVYECSMN